MVAAAVAAVAEGVVVEVAIEVEVAVAVAAALSCNSMNRQLPYIVRRLRASCISRPRARGIAPLDSTKSTGSGNLHRSHPEDTLARPPTTHQQFHIAPDSRAICISRWDRVHIVRLTFYQLHHYHTSNIALL